MPSSTPQAVRKQIAERKLDPLYLLVGDDEAEMSQLAADLSSIVEAELRAFNFERLYAGERAGSPEAIVQWARTLPMMGDRRVIVVLRAEKIFKPKRRGKGEEEEESDATEAAADLDVLEAYAPSPAPMPSVVLG